MSEIPSVGGTPSLHPLPSRKNTPAVPPEQTLRALVKNILADGWRDGIHETASAAAPSWERHINAAPPSQDLHLFLRLCIDPLLGQSAADSVTSVFRHARAKAAYGAPVPPSPEEARTALEREWEGHPRGDTIAAILQRWMTDAVFLSTLLSIVASWDEERKNAIRAAIEEAKQTDLLTAFDAAMEKKV